MTFLIVWNKIKCKQSFICAVASNTAECLSCCALMNINVLFAEVVFEAGVQALVSLFSISLHGLFYGVAHIHKYLSSYCLAINQCTSRLAFPQQLHWLDANHPSLSLPSSHAGLQSDDVERLWKKQRFTKFEPVVVLFHLMTGYSFAFQRHDDLVIFIRSTAAQSVLLLWQVNLLFSERLELKLLW